jgi:predicted tellurium resistance membrane protein TerC
MKMFRSSDPWALVVIVLSFGLFFLALILKGFTHDLLLEAGVFLVSVKLILMAKKNTETENRVERHLTEIKELLASRYSRSAN